MKYFIDTSSWIKRYTGEYGYKEIDKIIKNEYIIILDLEIPELISNIFRIYNTGAINKEELEQLIDIIYNDLSGFHIIRNKEKHIYNFESLCRKNRQTIVDGLIIMAAQEISDDLILITSDLRLKKGAEFENLSVTVI